MDDSTSMHVNSPCLISCAYCGKGSIRVQHTSQCIERCLRDKGGDMLLLLSLLWWTIIVVIWCNSGDEHARTRTTLEHRSPYPSGEEDNASLHFCLL